MFINYKNFSFPIKKNIFALLKTKKYNLNHNFNEL